MEMEKEGYFRCQRIFANTHLIIDIVFAFYLLVEFTVGDKVVNTEVYFIVVGLLFIDTCFYFLRLWERRKINNIIRFAQLIGISFMFVVSFGQVSSIFMTILLWLLMIEGICFNDVTDAYNRRLTLVISLVPSLIVIVFYLVFVQFSQNILLPVLSVLFSLTIVADKLTTMIADQLDSSEKKYFAQKRFAEQTDKAINELKVQQEKVKKANEELGIQKVKLQSAYDKINNVNREMTTQNMILKYISSSLELNTLMGLITEAILESFGLNACGIILLPNNKMNSNTLTYNLRTKVSSKAEDLLREHILLGSFQPFMNSKKIFVDNQIIKDRYPFIQEREISSLLIIPLIQGNEVRGALFCGHAQYDYFEDNQEFFETIVAQFLIALNNAEMYSKMEQMAIRDSLTGIYNRRHLNTLVDEYSKQAQSNNSSLSIALLDIDNFKMINDTYGHLFGDEVIQLIASLADEISTKYNGFAARYGGEEFVMVLPKRGAKECYEAVEEVRNRLVQSTLNFENHVITIRISAGISSYPETCKHLPQLLGRADEAMYYSKRTGRNRITVDHNDSME